jgi:aminoglycoside phosphotransferase (APT) family kinase protein
MPDTTIEADRFAARLAQHLPGAAEVRVLEVVKYPRGVSRETWAVRAAISGDGGPAERWYSIRRDLPGGAVQPYPLRLEWEVYRRLWGTPVPIARPMWFEDDPEWLLDGRSYYVRERVDGDWDIPHVRDRDPQYDAVRVRAAKEHLSKLALVHRLDWRALGFAEVFDVPPSAREAGRFRVDRLAALLRSYQVEPLPLVTECLEWLRDNAPPAPAIVLCKGTNGLGEEVFRDGVIVAMSDWEEACLGDPANDFAHTQDLLPPPDGRGFGGWGLQDALEYYAALSGIDVPAESVAFYRVLRSLEVVLFSHHAALPLVRGTDYLARLAWVATEMLHLGQLGLARAAGLFATGGQR